MSRRVKFGTRWAKVWSLAILVAIVAAAAFFMSQPAPSGHWLTWPMGALWAWNIWTWSKIVSDEFSPDAYDLSKGRKKP